MSKNENFDTFAIPRNFGEDGMTFGGLSRRNLVEGIALAASSGYAIFKFLSAGVAVKVILACFICIPLFFIGVVGIGGMSLTEFIFTFFRWLFSRRILHYYIDDGKEISLEKSKGKDRLILKKTKKQFNLFSKKKEAVTEKLPDEQEIKNNSSDFLPIKNVKHGIVETKDGKFLKVVEVVPINFMLRSAKEQREIIISFSELLRILPVKLQFKSISHKANIDKFLEQTSKALSEETNEACQEMGQDYTEFVQNIATEDAISRRFFVIFEYVNPFPANRPELEEIKFVLNSVVQNFRTYLSRCGNSLVTFDNEIEENKFLMQFYYDYYNYYNLDGMSREDKENMAFRLRLEGKNVDNMKVSDYLAPNKIDLTSKNYILIDGVYHCFLYIPTTGFKTIVGASWLSGLINAGEAIDVDLFLQKEPSDQMQQQVSRKLRLNRAKMSEVSTTSADFQSLGDIMESGYYIQKGLSSGQEFYYMSVIVTVKDFDKKSLEHRVDQLVKALITQQMDLRVGNYLQEKLYQSTMPFAKIDSQVFQLSKRNILTSTAASTYMFTSFELCDDGGILMGTNQHNNSLVAIDLFNTARYKNANLVLLGTSGAGKTYTLQCIATRLRRLQIQTFIIAPLKGHEFARCAKAIGGEFVRLSSGSPNCINVMEIRQKSNFMEEFLQDEEEDSYLSEKIDSLLVFFSLLMPEMENYEEQLLDEALVRTYERKGITGENSSLWDENNPGEFKEMPILGDLYAVLKEMDNAERLAIILNRFVNGSAKSFNNHTNVDLTNKYIVIDISRLKKKLLTAGMFIALEYVLDKTKENPTHQKAIIIDEIWHLLGSESNSVAAEYVHSSWKIVRGYGASMIGATQDISDFYALEDGKFGKAIINNSSNKIILNLEPQEAEDVGKILQLTPTEIQKIKHFGRGQGIISSNGNNVAVDFKASQMENALITTDPMELRAMFEEQQANKENTYF